MNTCNSYPAGTTEIEEPPQSSRVAGDAAVSDVSGRLDVEGWPSSETLARSYHSVLAGRGGVPLSWPGVPVFYSILHVIHDGESRRFLKFNGLQSLGVDRFVGISLMGIPHRQRYLPGSLPGVELDCLSFDGHRSSTNGNKCETCRRPNASPPDIKCQLIERAAFVFLDLCTRVVWRFDFFRNGPVDTLSEFENFRDESGSRGGSHQAGFLVSLSLAMAPRETAAPTRYTPRLTLLSTERRNAREFARFARNVERDVRRDIARTLMRGQ